VVADNTQASVRAADFRARHGLGDAPIRDVIQVVEDFCDAFVFSEPFPDVYEAFTMQDEVAGTIIIAVGTSENHERQRFSIAHELGHLESGRMSADVHEAPDFERNPDEIWADTFARHLLLPLSAIDTYLSDSESTKEELTVEALSDLIRVFGISPKPAMIQLKSAGWITGNTFDEWFSDRSLTSRGLALRYGWSSERDAMVRAALTPRRPTRLVQAAVAAYQVGDTSIEALAQASGRRDLETYQSELQEVGIEQVVADDATDGDYITEDFSDLYQTDL
jgi:Zn-dependent peptidase ImmA (M78 family)